MIEFVRDYRNPRLLGYVDYTKGQKVEGLPLEAVEYLIDSAAAVLVEEKKTVDVEKPKRGRPKVSK